MELLEYGQELQENFLSNLMVNNNDTNIYFID